MLTCRRRHETCEKTLASWRKTDWPSDPIVHLDDAPEDPAQPWGSAARSRRVTDAFAKMLGTILAEQKPDDEWLLLLEDDLEFNPTIAKQLRQWVPLQYERCILGTLFNPSLPRTTRRPLFPKSFPTDSKSFLGAQALLIRRRHARYVLEKWPFHTGMQAQRVAKMLAPYGSIYVHTPSLVQHVGKDSSWGANPMRALDFAS
jgi:hypothetical protein